MDFQRGRATAHNLVGSRWLPASSAESLDIKSPWTGQVIGSVGLSGRADVAAVVEAAREPAAVWARTPLKERVRPLTRFHELLTQSLTELSETVAL
ncbi:MAG TPA: aldehyde dehydrogenase family protein, partial [Polyangiaceae bacterium]